MSRLPNTSSSSARENPAAASLAAAAAAVAAGIPKGGRLPAQRLRKLDSVCPFALATFALRSAARHWSADCPGGSFSWPAALTHFAFSLPCTAATLAPSLLSLTMQFCSPRLMAPCAVGAARTAAATIATATSVLASRRRFTLSPSSSIATIKLTGSGAPVVPQLWRRHWSPPSNCIHQRIDLARVGDRWARFGRLAL